MNKFVFLLLIGVTSGCATTATRFENTEDTFEVMKLDPVPLSEQVVPDPYGEDVAPAAGVDLVLT